MVSRLFLPALGLIFVLSACQTLPEPAPSIVQEEPAEPEPIDVPEPPDADTPMLDEWGGEIPLSQPTEPVIDDGLDDLP